MKVCVTIASHYSGWAKYLLGGKGVINYVLTFKYLRRANPLQRDLMFVFLVIAALTLERETSEIIQMSLTAEIIYAIVATTGFEPGGLGRPRYQ